MDHPEVAVVKKAKKGISSIIFSRTALILVLLLLQLGLMFAMTTVLKEYRSYFSTLMTLLRAIVIIYIINERGNPAFNMTWILLILIFPVFGILFYLYAKSQVGSRNLSKRLSRQKLETHKYMRQNPEVIQDLRVSKPADANLAHYMKYQLGFPVHRNTKATFYSCGEEKFPALVEALQNARKFIFMEYFIVEESYMWNTILAILKVKVKEGVEVRFMYDGMGCVSLPHNYPKELKRYGINCRVFSPLRPALSTVQNNRDHRKICVIDGEVAFTGGINLGDEYINQKERFGYWKDTAVKLEGDAVQSFTIMFLQMWHAVERSKENYKKYLTPMSSDKKRELGFVMPYGDSPFDNEEVGESVYLHILNHAKKYVLIMTPYLILDNAMLDTLTKTAKSGIEVCIIMPHIPDKWYAFALAKTYYHELLEAGVQIYEFTPGFVHAKIFVSDNDTATIGTVNLDYRSLYLHFECGAFIYNNPVVRDVEKDFQKTLTKCQRISMADVKSLGLGTKICGRILRLIAPLM